MEECHIDGTRTRSGQVVEGGDKKEEKNGLAYDEKRDPTIRCDDNNS